MSLVQPPLIPSAKAALAGGNKIEAVRLLREETGMSLVEAKKAVDEQSAVVILSAAASNPDGQLPADVLAALANGQKIEAIKLLREATGLGLKEAKDALDAFERKASMGANSAPGEVPRRSLLGLLPWLAAAVLAVGAYAFFKRG